jgi:hypothetical protein
MSDVVLQFQQQSYLQFRHECLESVNEDTSMWMSDRLPIQDLLEGAEECVELLGLDDWPWYNVDPPAMKTRDEVRLLLPLDNLLKLETESETSNEQLDQCMQIQGWTPTLS